jgi:hypothetical protein
MATQTKIIKIIKRIKDIKIILNEFIKIIISIRIKK